MAIDCQSVGISTTCKPRERIKRGVESDLCYYFDPAKITWPALLRRRDLSVKQRQRLPKPGPRRRDRSFTIEKITDRPGISLRRLNVPEFWRVLKGAEFGMRSNGSSHPGTYIAAEKSQFLPVRPERRPRAVDLGKRNSPAGRPGNGGFAIGHVMSLYWRSGSMASLLINCW